MEVLDLALLGEGLVQIDPFGDHGAGHSIAEPLAGPNHLGALLRELAVADAHDAHHAIERPAPQSSA